MKFIELTGKKVGLLTVLNFAGNNDQGRRIWRCVCECGNEVLFTTTVLHRDIAKSCGCLLAAHRKRGNKKHGKRYTKEYHVWREMKARCSRETHPSFKHYGGRGIVVCERWQNSFLDFFEDMGECPSGLSLDRIDNNEGYHLENCRWATKETQAYNQRKRSTNKSGKVGVWWDKKLNRWVAFIRSEGKAIYLGSFENVEDAIQKRKEAELKYYGYTKD